MHPLAHPVALISEAECIGCTKCIQVCPVDAILGSAKKMHTVITNQCTGCEACIIACPVDCIELKPLLDESIDWIARAQEALFNTQKRDERLAKIALQKAQERENATKRRNIKIEIQACIARKKSNTLNEPSQTNRNI